MSATTMTAADGRRAGIDFVGLLHSWPMGQLLPGSIHNQRILDHLLHKALMAGKSPEVDDVAACARMHHFFWVLGALYDEGHLLATAPAIVRGEFLDCLRIATEATDLEAPEVMQ